MDAAIDRKEPLMKRLRHPIRAIREPFGTAGLIIAMVALVAALGGSAVAANSALSGKQKKEVEKIAKKYAGKPGANGTNGSNGSAGAKGDAGAPGSNGSVGGNGKSVVTSAAPTGSGSGKCVSGGTKLEVEGSGTSSVVCNGQTGFTATLPSGKTETGTWATPTTAQEVAISFNIPLAASVAAHFVRSSAGNEEWVYNATEEKGEWVPADGECNGSQAEPTAEPGNLCIYETFRLTHPISSKLFFADPEDLLEEVAMTTGRTGIALRLAAGLGANLGDWAVTAP